MTLPFQAGLDSLEQGLSVFDRDQRLVVCNRRFVELLELPAPLARCGASYVELVRHLAARGDLGPGDVEELVARRVRAAERPLRSYSERTTADGRVLAAQTHPMPDGGFVTVYTDVTDRARTEALTRARSEALEARVNQRLLELRSVNERLRANEARLRLVTDGIPAAIAYVDADLRLRFANRRFARLVDRKGDAVLGQHVAELFGGPLVAGLAEPIAAALAGRSDTFERTFRARGGREIVTRTTLIPELGDGGRVLGAFVLTLDVTEEKRAARALHEAQKMSAIGQLAGGLAHDFNNLLTVIVGNLGSLRERIAPELARELVEPAVRASHRGADITRRLLAFARQQSLVPAPVDVPALLAGAAQLLRRSLPANIVVECHADDDSWPALADAAQLENAIINLALNARDAMPDGGVLSLGAANLHIEAGAEPPPGDYLEIRVADTGTGIAPEVRGRILEPFFTTKPFGSGSGLGLSMVFGFARQSGGDLRVASDVGRGTRMTLLLPRAAAAPEAPVALDPAPGGRGELVLLVEDHEDVRQAVRRQLVELGYQVLEASDGEDAAALLASVPNVAVLVSDVVMPGALDGIRLADEARRLVPGIHVVLISGFANFDGDGYDRSVLRKPFGKDDLARALHLARP
jgi:PAS domain S-box-containing protein